MFRRHLHITAILPLLFAIALATASCSTQKHFVEKKYSSTDLRKDFSIFRGALEESHPSLYWFTPKDSMNAAFDEGFGRLGDSMTERQFRTTLLKVVTSIRCGHTSVAFSKKYAEYLDTARLPLFPLVLKVLKDTLVVTGSLSRDSVAIGRGTVITSIDNRSAKFLIDTMLNYITGDANSMVGRYQSLSSYGTFGVMYKNLFGLPDSLHIRFRNLPGAEDSATISIFTPPPRTTDVADSLKSRQRRSFSSYSSRSLQVDTVLRSGYMTINSFVAAKGIRRFFRSSFRSIRKLNLRHLAIDVRSNGGGDAGISTLLTRYLSDHSFVLADSLYGIKRSTRYRRFVRRHTLNWLMMTIATRRHRDGLFHFGYFERHRFHPIQKNHFDGDIYILTGGNSFSATTLFVQELKGQKNVRVVGEETGGGAYGNTAWIISELRLPNTGLRVSIPKLRFVMRKDLVAAGHGVMPDLYVAPTVEDIRRGVDVKVEAVRNLIMNGQINRR